MKLIMSIFLMFCSISYLAFEGVVHGIKTTNGQVEEFDIYIKGDKICVEGTNSSGFFRIVFDRGSDEMIICMDSPMYDGKNYFKLDVSQNEKLKKIQVLSTVQKAGSDNNTIKTYSMLTNQGSAIIEVDTQSNADLSGLSKYLDDPVYELIDYYGITNSIQKIVVNKPAQSYDIKLSATEQDVNDAKFEIPKGYKEMIIGVE